MPLALNGSLTASQLSSSVSSLSPSRGASSEVSKVYKQASQLFLTRRLSESLSTLLRVISVPTAPEDGRISDDDDSPPQALIASASSKVRIKIWSLYLTLLNAIIELGPEEGKRAFGIKEWKALVSTARDGVVWETVVKVGYGGREGSVDADVVNNLSTLLLTQAPSQTLNQQRLENYLSSSYQPNLDVDSHLQQSPTNGRRATGSRHNGTDTPRDLDSRIKILELFTLHILPRNEEWEYAQEFISTSEVLDEERRDHFLQTLEQLKYDKMSDSKREEDIQRGRDEDLSRQRQEEERKRPEEAQDEENQRHSERDGTGHKKTSSEIDYGIEKSHPNGKPTSKTMKPASKATRDAVAGRTTFSPPPNSPKQARKSAKSTNMLKQARILMAALQNLVKNMAQSMSANPMALLRTILFVMGIILAFSRRDVRDRLRRMTGSGWEKVRNTVGMGVKVSYI